MSGEFLFAFGFVLGSQHLSSGQQHGVMLSDVEPHHGHQLLFVLGQPALKDVGLFWPASRFFSGQWPLCSFFSGAPGWLLFGVCQFFFSQC